MRTIKVTFSDGDHLVTNINGTNEEILAYYQPARHIPQDYDMRHPERTRTVTNIEFLS